MPNTIARHLVYLTKEDAMSTMSEEQTRLFPTIMEPGTHDRYAHHARKADVLASIMTGQVINAPCRKRFARTRDTKKFPNCPRCKEIYTALPGA